MNFTHTPPTTPGFYAWRANEQDDEPEVCQIIIGGTGELIALFAGGHDVQLEWTIPKAGGQWCKLVPADEIEKAWIESYDDVIGIKGTALPTERWLKSRAKRVMDGNADNPVTQLDPQSPYEGQV